MINTDILPYFKMPYDSICEPMPLVMGISQTNRCELYLISSNQYRAATTPETFWLFVNEKTNLWNDAINNKNADAAMQLANYYSLSKNNEVFSLKWLTIALALGDKMPIVYFKVYPGTDSLRSDMCYVFNLTTNQVKTLIKKSEKKNNEKCALRLALYYEFSKVSKEKALYWFKRAKALGSKGAALYLDNIKSVE